MRALCFPFRGYLNMAGSWKWRTPRFRLGATLDWIAELAPARTGETRALRAPQRETVGRFHHPLWPVSDAHLRTVIVLPRTVHRYNSRLVQPLHFFSEGTNPTCIEITRREIKSRPPSWYDEWLNESNEWILKNIFLKNGLICGVLYIFM